MRGAQWLELLCWHIPERYEHLVRYYGWYSSRARHTRADRGAVAVANVAAEEEIAVTPARQYLLPRTDHGLS
jgi:hypothetical protein